MTAIAEQLVITQPGVYDIPAGAYHADPAPTPSLSSTGARRLLPPSCPAKFAYERENGSPAKRELDLGKAAHHVVLGVGPELVPVNADNYLTKAAQAIRDEARSGGAVPLLNHEVDQVQAMAAAIRAHPTAAALLSQGRPEQALFWIDQPTGTWCRALLDWLPSNTAGRSMWLPEYKTTHTAAPERLDKLVLDRGYHIQAAWNIEAVKALGLAHEVEWYWIWQEKTPPYLVTVGPIRDIALRIGTEEVRRAIDLYASCTTTGRWPGYGDDELVAVGLPGWVENEYLRETSR